MEHGLAAGHRRAGPRVGSAAVSPHQRRACRGARAGFREARSALIEGDNLKRALVSSGERRNPGEQSASSEPARVTIRRNFTGPRVVRELGPGSRRLACGAPSHQISGGLERLLPGMPDKVLFVLVGIVALRGSRARTKGPGALLFPPLPALRSWRGSPQGHPGEGRGSR